MKTMVARYNGRCKDCGADIRKGDTIRFSKATGALCADADDCSYDAGAESERRYFDRIDRQYEIRGFYDDGYHSDYERGRAEVEQIQAVSEAGSDYRDMLYREMEMAAYNRGED